MYVVSLARKPLSESTVVTNVLEQGCGGLHIDATRTAYADEADRQANAFRPGRGKQDGNHNADFPHLSADWGAWTGGNGRWPTNLILESAVAETLDERSLGTGGVSRFFRVLDD